MEVLSSRKFWPVKGLDLALWLDPVEAVVFVDVLARRGLVSHASLIGYRDRRGGERGAVRLGTVVDLMDAKAESPAESRLRARLLLAGLPKFTAQHVITMDGVFVARVDLAFPELKIALEYDGRWHAATAQFEPDRERLNRLIEAEWAVLHVTADQMRDRFDQLVARLRMSIRSGLKRG